MVSADPGDSTKLVTEWDVPQVLIRGPDGTPSYQLDWWRVVGNREDQPPWTFAYPKGGAGMRTPTVDDPVERRLLPYVAHRRSGGCRSGGLKKAPKV